MDIACWCHLSRDFLGDDSEVKYRMDQTKEGGINILLPFIHGSRDAWYKTDLNYSNQEDRLARVIKFAKEREIEIHPVVLPIVGVGLSDGERIRRSYNSGRPEEKFRNFCASWAENRDTGFDVTMDIIKNCDIEGIHLDAIRYEDTGQSLTHPCQCEACRAKYKELLGMDTITGDDLTVPGIIYKYIQFRNENIYQLTKKINKAVKEKGLVLSMAARTIYLGTGLSVPADLLVRILRTSNKEEQDWRKEAALLEGQDWIEWGREGLMDFISPMNYSTDREYHRKRLSEQMDLLGNSAKIYDGLGRKSSFGEITAKEMVQQAEDSLKLGAKGIAIFHFNILNEEDFRELAAFKKANT